MKLIIARLFAAAVTLILLRQQFIRGKYWLATLPLSAVNIGTLLVKDHPIVLRTVSVISVGRTREQSQNKQAA